MSRELAFFMEANSRRERDVYISIEKYEKEGGGRTELFQGLQLGFERASSSATQIQAIHLSCQVILEEVVEHLGGLPPIYNSSQRYGEWQACTAARIPNLIESY
ncbi:hypothetical protein VPH35_130906 [Triticum aestivum]